MRFLTFQEKKEIIALLNPNSANTKLCKWFKLLGEHKDGLTVEVGYWIDYTSCRPVYEKIQLFLPFKTKKWKKKTGRRS